MTTTGPTRRWLTDIAALHSAFADTPTVARLVRSAVIHARRSSDFSDTLEKKLVASFTAAKCRAIAAEMNLSNFPLSDLTQLTGVRIEAIEGFRQPADCWIVWQHSDGEETRVPINIKGIRRKQQLCAGDFACALGPFLAWLTMPNGKIDKRFKGNPDELLIDLVRGTRKLVPGRDYFLWSIEDRGGPVTHNLRSLVSRHHADGTGLAIWRHTQRNVVNYTSNVGTTIGPSVDIARELAIALLPSSGVGRLQVELLAAIPASSRRRVAQALAKLTDEELVAKLLSDLN